MIFSRLGRYHWVLAALLCCTLSGCSLESIDLDTFNFLPKPTSVEQAKAERVESLVQSVDNAELSESGVLTVGVLSSTGAPFSSLDSEGSYQGFDIELAKVLAETLGLSQVKFLPCETADAAFASGCDVVFNVESDAEGVIVVGNYLQNAIGVFSNAESVSVPLDAADLSGASMGVQANSESESLITKLGLAVDVHEYTNVNEAFDALAAGEVSYVACNAYSGAYLAYNYEGISFAGTLNMPVSVGIAVDSDAVNLQSSVQSALDELLGNGTGTIVRIQWLGVFPTLNQSTMITSLPDLTEEVSEGVDAAESNDEGAEAETESDAEAEAEEASSE